MKVLILAGGYGTRISEETGVKPKPMVEIGGRPILWHIMKHYSHYGHNEFVVLLGYKGHVIKEYFANYWINQTSFTIDLQENNITSLNSNVEPWKVTLLDTGIDTMTGGRIKKAQEIVGQESFMLTYGDGVSDVDINQLIQKHREDKKYLSMTAVKPKGRFGILEFDQNNQLTSFQEKPTGLAWINGGFFVCEPEVFNYIDDSDQCIFERSPLNNLAKDRQIHSYKHQGFWKCMDTLADKNSLQDLWDKNEAQWKVW